MKAIFKSMMLRFPLWSWALLLVLLVVVLNFLSRNFAGHIDLTSNQRYTLSDGSKKILQELEQPVRIRFYLSESDNILPLELRNFASRVEDLLDVLADASEGKLKIEKYDPIPDSEAEIAANLDGIRGEQIGPDLFTYFGLTVNGLIQTRALPFLEPRNEVNLEYEILRAIRQVTTETLPKIGIYSTVSTFEGSEDQGGASALVHLLRGEAEVIRLSGDETSFPAEMETIIVIHPRGLSTSFTMAVQKHMAAGNGLSLLLDPLTISEFFYGKVPTPDELASSWPEMLELLGVTFAQDQAVLDMRLKASVDRGQGEEVLNYLLDYDREGLNLDHPVTQSVGDLRLVAAGSLAHVDASRFSSSTLVQSTRDSSLFPAKNLMRVSSYDARQLLQRFQADDEIYHIALMLEGRVTPAAQPCRALVMADVDFMTDPFAGTTRKVQDRQVFDPVNGSMGFFLNALEHVRGGQGLSEIRNRKHQSRPFTRLVDLRREAEERYRSRIAELESQLEKLQTSNFAGNAANSLAVSGQNLDPKTVTAIRESKQVEKKLNEELYLIRRQLRSDVKQIESRIKWLNIAGIPLVVLLLGGLIVILRHHKSRPRASV